MKRNVTTAPRPGWPVGLLCFVLILSAGLSVARAESINPHGEMTIDCAVCHTASSWSVPTRIEGFDHTEIAQYPLTLAHASTSCRSCHSDLVFSRATTDCTSCHDDIHNSDLGDRCSRCHTPDTWGAMSAAISEHTNTNFPLLGEHATTACASCHSSALAGTFRDASTECGGCHIGEFFETTDPDHSLAAFSNECTECHSSAAVSWVPARFDHPGTFPLALGHADVTCASCHLAEYESASTDCVTCHLADSEQASPNHDGFDLNCTACHNLSSWESANFEHSPSFKLDLGHSGLDCASCHSSGYEGTSVQCVECHLVDSQQAVPSHDGYSEDCTSCHSVAAWTPANFEHPSSFPLTLGHIDVDCASCHIAGYENTSSECVACHLADSQQAVPDHDGFSEGCTACHSVVAWEPAAFEHPSTFPLTLGHVDLDCASCHSTGYDDTSTECIDCHRPDYQSADPNHVTGGFPEDCTACHTLSSWQPANFEHPLTFPLSQGHADLVCASCHISGYEGTSPDCVDCHLTDSQQAAPSHTGFSEDCTSCHSVVAWEPADFEHSGSFPLTLGHTDVDCASCHSAGYENTSTDCVDCHLPDYESADPDHVAGGFPQSCTTCHTLSSWQPAGFEHISTFPLSQGHAELLCASCHVSGYEGTSPDCFDCHLADSQQAIPSHGGLADDCTSCHSTASWQPSSFDHPTSFPLTDGHGSADCASCHSTSYENTPTECIECHLADSEQATPSHAGFSEDCTSCHSVVAWEPANFEHPSSFPLTEGHDGVDCASCHISGYEATPTDCVECHLADSQSADPSHTGFPQDCTTCHDRSAWTPANYGHVDNFPLTGGHAGVDCTSCHSDGYENTSPECVDCHLADSEQANPSHSGFPQDCTACHTIEEWTPADFAHPSSFPLTQGHAELDCASCHSGGYKNTPTDCVACHLADSQSAEPSHDGLPQDCTICHTPSSWIPADFSHPNNFPLAGGHNNLDCAACHSGGYDNTSPECVDCHLGDSQTAEPNHDGFPQNCATCHTIQEWSPADFDHPNNFPLAGGHSDLSCASCHSGGYDDTPTNCVDCHLSDSQAADPSHSGLPTDCTTCHNTNEWTPSSFAHTLRFPLIQGHAAVDCASCHSGGYDNTPANCVDCHSADSQNATPNHTGLPSDCRVCHSLIGWIPSNFAHTQTFPLAQGHAEADCASCHTAGYDNTSTDCVDCHLADSQTAVPSHGGFPLACTTCHTVAAWTPAGFDHTGSFPLTGGHASPGCADCHSGGYDNTSPVCVDCHLSDSQAAVPSHDGLPVDCMGCHTIDGWIPSGFVHTQAFPLAQGHAEVDCASCHTAGYDNTPTDCVDCHLADSQSAQPSHDGFPLDCTTCHTVAAWTPAGFDHTGSFPLTGGHANPGCADCHSGGYDNTSPVCVNCHLSDSQAAVPSHSGLPADCMACHSINGWVPSNFIHTGSFPLSQGHAGVTCADCHTAGYDNTPTDCVDCHLADSQSAQPSHDGFPLDCTTCHTLAAWTPADFNHTPSFPLAGGHADRACSDCHSGGYDNTPNECVECHLADFMTAEPDHVDGGFPEDCTACHTIQAWSPADFDHAASFPLTAGHGGLQCADCHSGGYGGTSSECISCHLGDYNSASPDHDGAGFPEDCTSCHSLSAWNPADFRHDSRWFPIYSGKHREAWNTCIDCHTNPSDFTVFSCIDCHEHRRSDVDDDHSDVGGYVYDSDACYSCHPRGDD